MLVKSGALCFAVSAILLVLFFGNSAVSHARALAENHLNPVPQSMQTLRFTPHGDIMRPLGPFRLYPGSAGSYLPFQLFTESL